MKLARKSIRSVLAFFILFSCLGTKIVQAQVSPANDGTGTKINRTPTQFDITGGTRSGSNLFHSFDQFGLNRGQTANFLSNPSIQNILGRITGGSPSLINGLIQVTGGSSSLYLMNPSGMIFGIGARLNVPGAFTATTANGIGFGNGWFSALPSAHAGVSGNPNYAQLIGNPSEFTFANGGSLFNAGTLTARSITLLGGTVVNTGTIEAPGGNVTIAAIPDQKLVRITQAGNLLSVDLPMQAGLQARSLPELLTGGDLANATGVTVENGIVKIAGTPVSTQTGSAIVAGQVSVAGETPGKVQVVGDRIHLINANINASGAMGGGTILVGGEAHGQGTMPRANSTISDAQTKISADATRQGAGGTVVLWSDDATRVQSNMSARGIDRGGFVETSGKRTLDVNGAIVNASTTKGNPGTWLLDPTDINIATTGGTITPGAIQTSLDTGTNVSLTTAGAGAGTGDITLTDSVNQAGGGTASLTLTGRRLLRPGSAVFNLSTAGDLTFNLNQVNPEATVPTSAVQTAIATIGTVPGNRIINLGAGTYTGGTLSLNGRFTIQGAGATTILDGGSARQVVNVGSAGNVMLDGVTIANSNNGSGIATSGTLKVSNSTINNNKSSTVGGGILNTGALTVTNSTFSGNSTGAGFNGGGIQNNGGTLTVSNSTFSGNSAVNGGGIRIASGTATVSNSTFSGNSATSSGGGISSNSTTTLRNNLIAGNTAPTGREISVTSGTVSTNNNLYGYSSSNGVSGLTPAATDITPTVPLNQILSTTLGNNGGTTKTLALVSGSPAIDAGDPASTLKIDQRGAQRLNAGTRIDIGAYEATSSYLVTNTLDDNSIGSLRSAINFTNININPVAATPLQTIQFGIGTVGSAQTISLTNALPTLTAQTLIDGWTQGGTGYAGAPLVTVSGSNLFRVFNIATTGTVTLNGLTIANGSTTTSGAGILNNGNTTIRNSILQNNVANGSSSDGGGIYNRNQLSIDKTTIRNNTSGDDGGGIRNDSILTITNSTVSGNTAQSGSSGTSGGGAILNTIPATATITNSTFSGNSAKVGGAIRNDGTLTLTNSTVSANTSTAIGGGVVNTVNPLNASQFGRATLQNTIIAGNTDTSNNAPDAVAFVANSFTDQGNNLIGIGDTFNSPFNATTLRGTAATPLSSLLAPLANYGGTTQTHALLPGSLAINAGTATGSPAQDQRGQARVSTPDIGAFESQGFTIAATGGTPQSTTVNTAFTTPITATVTANNAIEPVAGGAVTYIAPTAGATLTATGQMATIDASGNANLTPTATTTAGTYTALATASGATGTADFALTNTPDAPFSIVATGGTPQSAVVNTSYAQALQVTVRDQFNNLIPGATVSFGIPGSGASGTLTAATATTDASGNATVSITANTIAGNFAASSQVGGVATPANFSLTNLADVPFSITATNGSGQSTTVNTNFTNPLQTTVRDQYGNPVPNATVSFNVPGTGASGILTAVTATTDTSGNATVNITANTVSGTYNSSGSVTGVATPATFSLTNTPGVVTRFDLTGFPSPTSAGNTGSFTITAFDAFNNLATNYTGTIGFSSSDTQSTLPGASTLTNGTGTFNATFRTAGTRSLTGTDANLSVSATQTGIIVNPSDPYFIGATGGNSQSTIVNTPFASNLQATVYDIYNNAIPGVNVVFQLPGSGASGIFTGSSTLATDATGSVSMPIRANTIAGQFTAQAQVSAKNSFSEIPASFSLTNNPDVPFSVSAIAGNSQSTIVNTAFTNPIQVQVRDQFGNATPNAVVSFNAPLSGASTQTSGATVNTDASGIAGVAIAANTISGQFISRASVIGLTPAIFNLTNRPDRPASITAIAGDGQRTVVNTAFNQSLQVLVRDRFGNVVPNATVRFASPTIGASGRPASSIVTTDTSGRTQVMINANTIAGTFSTSGTVEGVNDAARFSLTNLADVPAQAIAANTNQQIPAKRAFLQPLQVTILDRFGNPVPDSRVTFVLPVQGASGRFVNGLQNITVSTNANGIAQVQVIANDVSGRFIGTATVSGVTPSQFSLSNLSGLTLAEEVRLNQDFFGQPLHQNRFLPINPAPLLCADRDRSGALDAYQGVSACLNSISRQP